MTTPAAFLITLALARSIVALSTPLSAQANEVSLADFDRMLEEQSNWGRWGSEDQLGTLNLLTPEKRQAAARLVLSGKPVSLARPAATETGIDNPWPFQHTMIPSSLETKSPFARDEYRVAYHGLAQTHMDALCHLFYKGRMYNGFSRDEVTEKGAAKLGIENVSQGIMARGILFDIPKLRGVDYLEPGTPIYPEDLTAWETFTQLSVRPGDAIFIRTGRWARRDKIGPWDVATEGLAGLHASCGPWLKERDIALLGSDAAADVIPSGVPGVSHPIHVLTLYAMGVHLLDNCDLEELARVANEQGRWEFLLTAAPLIVEGGTGSPINPVATF